MITNEQEQALRGWFAGRLPEGLFVELLDVTVDREEITVIGRIPEPDLAAEASEVEREASLDGRVSEFRNAPATNASGSRVRPRPVRAQSRGRGVRRRARRAHHGVRTGDDATTPARASGAGHPDRRRRRPKSSRALAWCVRLVQRNADTWLSDLRDSLEHVQQVRAQGPDAE